MGRLLAETAAATALSVLALAATAKLARRGALQPLNATSHWLNGTVAAAKVGGGWRTTGVGLLTHVAATGFWAVLFELWVRRGRRTRREIAGKAAAMAGVAALVDYRATPKRFTPGWEFVLSPAAMAVVYFAMGTGFALAAGPLRRPAAKVGHEARRAF